MRRRRRRHADPATLPRRETSERQQHVERDRASRDLTRVDDSLARVVAVLAAAVVYFGTWAVNSVANIFPPPAGVDLTHPQFLIGAGSLVASLWLARYLVRRLSTRRLVVLATWSTSALGAILVLFLAALVAAPPTPAAEGFAVVTVGLGVSWLLSVLWVVLLARRARRLLALLG